MSPLANMTYRFFLVTPTFVRCSRCCLFSSDMACQKHTKPSTIRCDGDLHPPDPRVVHLDMDLDP